MQDQLFLGNLSSKRDWGHAKDYIKVMHLMLQQEQPDDYVIATGVTTTIRDFIKMAGAEIGLELSFKGEDVDEKGYLTDIDEKIFAENVGEQYLAGIKSRLLPSHPFNKSTSQQINIPLADVNHSSSSQLIGVDPTYFRPTEVELLIGDSTKARTKLGWKPEYDLKGLVAEMMQSDVKLMKKDAWLKEGGYRTLNYFE